MPTAATEFTLNADVFRLIPDSADAGADMDMPAFTGLQFYFDPDLPEPQHFLVASVTPRPQLIKPERVTGYIRSNGRMYDQPAVSAAPADLTDPGNIGVRLLANGAELNLDPAKPLTYTVSSNEVVVNGNPWGVTPWNIPAPTTDVTIDLAALAPVSAGDGVSILRGPPGPGADGVRLNGSNQVVFTYGGVDIPGPLSITPASVPDGSVTTVKIVDANVTLPKLSSGVQTSLGKADTALQSLGTDSVGSTQIAANAVGTAEIADGSVTLAKHSTAVQTSLGKADTALQSLATDSVGSTQIAANAVGQAELADNAVDGPAIQDGSVTLSKHSTAVQTSLGKADSAAQIAGDLGGTAAAPVVSKVNGVAVTGTPSAGQVMTATSPTAAQWQNATTGFVNPMTTAGDIIVRNATTTARKAVGTNGQVLRVNTANGDKLEYATLAAADVGLPLANNTADANKPVSTAQAAADATVLTTATGRAVAFALVF